jgi:hypothetical protein
LEVGLAVKIQTFLFLGLFVFFETAFLKSKPVAFVSFALMWSVGVFTPSTPLVISFPIPGRIQY